MHFSSLKEIKILSKASEGIYADTPANRKLGRVGMTYQAYAEKIEKIKKDKKAILDIKDIASYMIKLKYKMALRYLVYVAEMDEDFNTSISGKDSGYLKTLSAAKKMYNAWKKELDKGVKNNCYIDIFIYEIENEELESEGCADYNFIGSVKGYYKEYRLTTTKKRYIEGIYADTYQNRKLGRVGLTYKEYNEIIKKI